MTVHQPLMSVLSLCPSAAKLEIPSVFNVSFNIVNFKKSDPTSSLQGHVLKRSDKVVMKKLLQKNTSNGL